ncbi:MAG: hypothetical protein PHI56_09505, partial [Victivallaceae bacterium]|nr:hypothetical protein [Victivallaceae bacterium]
GYKFSSKKGIGKLGPDIKAVKDKEVLHIEVIGYAESGLERVGDFYEAFFSSLSRLNEKDCRHCIIAMPSFSKKLMPIRAKIHKVAWKRIAEAFPELEIWLVDIENKKYQKTTWISWLKQKK